MSDETSRQGAEHPVQPRRRPTDLVLCTGMPRSGSTWSYNACMSLLETAHPDAGVAGLYSENIPAVLAERSADYLVIKCHAVDEVGRGAIARGECRTVYTHRNPCEAVASSMAFAGHSFDEALGSIKASLEFMTFQRRCGDALLLSYTELTETPRQAIRKIADHLGLAVDDAAVAEADRRSSREAAAAIADEVEALAPAEVYRDGKYLYHRRSLIHRNHLAGGGATWQSALTAAQIRQIQRETPSWVDLLNEKAASREDRAAADWTAPYDRLRQRWTVVPAGPATRLDSATLMELPDAELLETWQAAFARASTGAGYGIRGWYHDLYRDQFRGLRVLDVGCGLAISTLHFAEHGARLTFTDVASDNVRVVERLCALKGVAAEFLYIEDERSFAALRDEFDVVLALGSLLNAPLRVIRDEIQAILPHLKDGGRWLHFAYPKARWEREGCLPFSQWGNRTDGPGTPWMEYHDREKLEFLFSPSRAEIVFDCEWHNHDFNWFDLRVRR